MATKASMISSFIEAAPPGELSEVITDIKNLTIDNPEHLDCQAPAFKRYNEDQCTTTRLPGASEEVLITSYNSLEDGRYYDVEHQMSFVFDHTTQKASAPQTYVSESRHLDLVKPLLQALSNYGREHFPSSSHGVYPIENDAKIAIVLVANKYSPSNFWNGRWRSQYIFDPSSGSLAGGVKVDVHYYEDGNVRLLCDKPVFIAMKSPASAADIMKQILTVEKKYQEDLNRAFINLSEGAFKNLRRQLPVTRQKVEWEKISGYRLGQEIGGGRSR